MRWSAGGAQSPFPVKPATREDTRDATSRVRSPGVYSSFGASGHRAGHTVIRGHQGVSGVIRGHHSSFGANGHEQDTRSGFIRFSIYGLLRSHHGSSPICALRGKGGGHHTLPQKSATVRLTRVSSTMLRSPNSYFSFPVILHT